jgi:hypothetical protein
MRPVQDLPGLHRERKCTLEQLQLPVDFRIADGAPLLGHPLFGPVVEDDRASLLSNDPIGLSFGDEPSHIGRSDVCQSPSAEKRREMQPDAPLDFVDRLLGVRREVVQQVCGCLVEREAPDFRHDGQATLDITLLWFESEEVPPLKRPVRRWDRDLDERESRDDEDEDGLKELDGNLRWPSKKRRR